MSVLAAQRRRGRVRTSDCEQGSAGSRPAADSPTLFTDVSGEPTLDELVSGVWEGLAAHRAVSCPLCGGEMLAHHGAHARPVVASCRDCATTLS